MSKMFFPFCLLFLITVTGCVHSTVQTYDGDLLAESERVTLTTDSKDLSIERVDGKKIRTIRQFWDSKWDAEVQLKPGEHEIEVKFWNGPTFGRHINSYYLFKLNAVAGHDYKVVHKLHERSAKSYIVDVETGGRVSQVVASQNEPVDNPTELYDNSPFFSILPPQDSGWIVVYRDRSQTAFAKEGRHPDETYAVFVRVIELPTLNSEKEFGEYVRTHKDKDLDTSRFKVIKEDKDNYSKREDFCVRYHTIVEDNKVSMALEMVDFICRHPLNKNLGIAFDFSHRYYPGNKDNDLAVNAEKLFGSLKF